MNKPVAWMACGVLFYFESYAEKMAKENNEKVIPLYTHPLDKLDKVLKQNERLLNAMIDQRKFWEAEIEKKNTLLKMWEASHPVKELTDKEILCLWDWWSGEILATDILDFADVYKRALLGEEGLIEECKQYVKKMNEEYELRKAQEK